jgi:hypothetical protein
MTARRSLRDYFVLEGRHAPRQAAVAMAIWGVAAIFGTHALLERFPERALRFLEQAFRIEGMAAILVVNDLLAAYFATFFVGMTGLLGTVVAAREEDRLEILLAKPIPARLFLAARVWPVLLWSGAVGAIVAVTTAFAIRPYLAPGDMVTAAGALGGGLFLVALALVLLAALLPLLVRMRDGFHALLVASIVWIAPAMPAGVFIYRPDLFDRSPLLRDAIVLATLVWHDATAEWLGPLALAVAIGPCAAFVAIAGRVLQRTDIG